MSDTFFLMYYKNIPVYHDPLIRTNTLLVTYKNKTPYNKTNIRKKSTDIQTISCNFDKQEDLENKIELLIKTIK